MFRFRYVCCWLVSPGVAASPANEKPIVIHTPNLKYPLEAKRRGMDGYATAVI